MSYVVPQFPLTVNLWRSALDGGAFLYNAPDLVFTGNLTPGKRVMQMKGGNTVNVLTTTIMELLCPAFTDIRTLFGNSWDVVEIPAGTMRLYDVNFVDDIGKGFANEHRFAFLTRRTAVFNFADIGASFWPVPLP